MRKIKFTSGRSLIEVVIILSISIFLLYIGVATFQRFIDQQRVNAATENAVGLIQKARSLTLSSRGGSSGLYYYIDVDSYANRLVLRDQWGNSIEVLDFAGTPILIEPPVGGFYFAKSDCVPSNNDLRFERITGDAKIYGNDWESICTSNYNWFKLRLKKDASGAGPAHTIKILNTGSIQIL